MKKESYLMHTVQSGKLPQNNINKNDFTPEFSNKNIDKNCLAFVFADKKLLLINNDIPIFDAIDRLKLNITYLKYLGKLSGKSCFVIEVKNYDSSLEEQFTAIRNIYNILPESQLMVAIYGYQITLWNKRTCYCGKCGSKISQLSSDVFVKSCEICKEEYYPKISPAVIVAIEKDDKLLLAQHTKVTNGMFTVLAGFVNPGESLEECIVREVKEEADIDIRNIKYFGSQPWPFPDSLMIAYTAEYAGGEIRPNEGEITELKWFGSEEIPEWPDKVSIARALIDNFIENQSKT
jgi:NAD+ diphosphatase